MAAETALPQRERQGKRLPAVPSLRADRSNSGREKHG
jgi:hypothetical protein